MQTQDIQNCINHCNQLANDLRNMAKTNNNPQMADILFEGAHHIDLCVTECGYAVHKAQGVIK